MIKSPQRHLNLCGLFGGEGLFNTKVTGPSKIWLQTMPADVMAQAISPFLSNAK